MQRARNGRGRHGEHVHFFLELLQLFFVAYAEALLLIHDHQSKIGELDVFREQPMGADEDIHLPRLNPLLNFFLLFRAAKAADHFDGQGKGGKALLESLPMLEGQDGCRSQHRNLFVIAHRFEGGAHGDFCLAVAHVAA